jgi:hypothetical protein
MDFFIVVEVVDFDVVLIRLAVRENITG